MKRQIVITLKQDAPRDALRVVYLALEEFFYGFEMIESIDKYRVENDLRPRTRENPDNYDDHTGQYDWDG